MEPLVKPSFIPKAPLTDTSRVQTKKSSGIFTFLILILLVGTGISYAYVRIQTQKFLKMKDDYIVRIEKARKEIGTEFVSDIVSLQKRISSTQNLLRDHVVVSPIFFALQETTVQKIQFKDFEYSIDIDSVTGKKMVSVKINGISPDYKTIALQTDAFLQNSLIKDPIISDIKNEDTTKTVGFVLEFKVDARDVSYEKFLEQKIPKTASKTLGRDELSYE
jgi:hypothetical protein